jgi:hypothetical protein
MDTPGMKYPRGDLRVSDADRDGAVSELSEHFQAGRLTPDELDERTGRALRARTGRELAELFTDLPRGRYPASGTAVQPASASPRVPLRLSTAPVAVVASALAALAIVAVIASVPAGHPVHPLRFLLVTVLVVLFVVRRAVRHHR